MINNILWLTPQNCPNKDLQHAERMALFACEAVQFVQASCPALAAHSPLTISIAVHR